MTKKKEETKTKVSAGPADEKIEVKLQPLNLKTMTLTVEGVTPLIMDKLPEEVMKEILDKQSGKGKTGKKLRDTKKEVERAIHRTRSGKVGFPAAGFKRGMMEVTSFVGGGKFFSKKLIAGAVRIVNAEDGLLPLKYTKMEVLNHNVGSNVKFSPMFKDWECEIQIQYDANNISAQDIVTCLNTAGHYIGVGAWRPKSRDGGSGEYGTYRVKISK